MGGWASNLTKLLWNRESDSRGSRWAAKKPLFAEATESCMIPPGTRAARDCGRILRIMRKWTPAILIAVQGLSPLDSFYLSVQRPPLQSMAAGRYITHL